MLAFVPMLLAIALLAGLAPAHAQKRIALTFDDVPRDRGAFFSPDERSARLLAGLAAARVAQAAFFVNPGFLANPDGAGGEARIAAYVAAGHVIANHSFSHPHLNATPAEAYLADIDKGEAWLRGRAGYRPWFRFPFLDEGGADKARRDAVRAGLAARGLRNGYVTAEGSDWNMEALTIDAVRAGKTLDMDALRTLYVETHVEAANFYEGLALRTLGRAPAQVLLLHETDLAALYVADLVAALRKDGWEIVTADAAFADPINRAMPDTPSASGTLIEAIAWEKGLPPPRWYERNIVSVANRLFAERVLKETPAAAQNFVGYYGPSARCLGGYVFRVGEAESLLAAGDEGNLRVRGNRFNWMRAEPDEAADGRKAEVTVVRVAGPGRVERFAFPTQYVTHRTGPGTTARVIEEAHVEYLLPAIGAYPAIRVRSPAFTGGRGDRALLRRFKLRGPATRCGVAPPDPDRTISVDAQQWSPVRVQGPAYICQGALGFALREGEVAEYSWEHIVTGERVWRVTGRGYQVTSYGWRSPMLRGPVGRLLAIGYRAGPNPEDDEETLLEPPAGYPATQDHDGRIRLRATGLNRTRLARFLRRFEYFRTGLRSCYRVKKDS